LAGAGKASLDLLRKLVADEDNWEYYSQILVTMALAGGPEIGPELNTMLEKELAFWKKTAPGLKGYWFTSPGPLARRYLKASLSYPP